MPTKLAYEKSFASHPKSQFWSPMNEGLPEDYSLNSHKKFIFDCDKCGHKFIRSLHDISGKNGWCSYCSKSNKKVCNDNDCLHCYNNSFASHPKSQFWSNKNLLNPRQVLQKTHKKYIFNCDKCNHEFIAMLSDITNNGSWCHFCSGRKLCDNALNCTFCLNKTFYTNEKKIYWSDKNDLKPYQVYKSSSVKIWFDCNKCSKSFQSKISHITDGSWCPNCRYKTEHKMTDILTKLYPNIIIQAKFDWCKNITFLPFDYVIGNVIVELDGEHHMIQVGKWKTPEHNRKRDLYKMECANKNGYSIIRILQEDVFKDKYNWLEELQLNIKKIEDDNIVQNIYMCKNNEYKDFDKLIKEDLDQFQEEV